MKRFLICFLILNLLLCNCNAIVLLAADSDHKFDERYEYLAVGEARSPARYTGGTDNYIRVTEKCNQPRNTTDGTSPHQGADMTMVAGTDVYAILPGVVTYVDIDTSDQLANVVINSDVNGDNTPDGIYICYMHIKPGTTINVNDWVLDSAVIGKIDIQRVFPAHLHLQWRDASSSATGHIQKLTLLYKHVSTYNNGADFDYLRISTWISNELYIKGYSKSGDTRAICTSMELYYKVGSSAWSSTPIQMSVFSASSYIFTYNLSNLPGATTGTTVQFYIVGKRNLNVSYNYGVLPQYYCVPPETPGDYSSFGASIEYCSKIIQ